MGQLTMGTHPGDNQVSLPKAGIYPSTGDVVPKDAMATSKETSCEAHLPAEVAPRSNIGGSAAKLGTWKASEWVPKLGMRRLLKAQKAAEHRRRWMTPVKRFSLSRETYPDSTVSVALQPHTICNDLDIESQLEHYWLMATGTLAYLVQMHPLRQHQSPPPLPCTNTPLALQFRHSTSGKASIGFIERHC